VSQDNQFLPEIERLRSNQTARFADLRSAGRHLAIALEEFKGREDTIVLGLILGGAPVAFEVAGHLGIPLDFVILRRLLAPGGPGSQVCAVNIAGSLVVDEELIRRPAVPASAFDHFISEALGDLAQRERVCREGRPTVELWQKTILLVDCGISTGSTMKATIRALRRKEPRQIVAAVPVASVEGCAAIEAVADKMVCLMSHEPFGHVGLWYRDFRRLDDNQVSELLSPDSATTTGFQTNSV
jgi:putative phosphoribosyl transferase